MVLLSNNGKRRLAGESKSLSASRLSFHLAKFLRVIVLPCALAVSGGIVLDESSSLFATEMTLVTTHGDRFRGDWLDSEDATSIKWQSEKFAGPFQFPPDALMAIHGSREIPHGDANDEGLSICELTNGGVLVGTPMGIDGDALQFAVESRDPATATETLSIPRSLLKRLTSPMQANELLVTLPGDGQALKKNMRGDWVQQGGKLVAQSLDAKCYAELPDLPARCLVEISVAWKSKTDFAVSLSPKLREPPVKANRRAQIVLLVGQQNKREKGEHSGLRLETWHDRVVLIARTAHQADVLSVSSDTGGNKAGSLRLQIFIDADRRTADVYRDGTYTGQLSLPKKMQTEWAKFSEVARLESFSGSLSLESFRISTWNGNTPMNASTETDVVRMADGKVILGRIADWDAEEGEFVFEELVVERRGDEGQGDSPVEVAGKIAVVDGEEEEATEEDGEEEGNAEVGNAEEKHVDEGDEEKLDEKERPKTQRIAMSEITEILFAAEESVNSDEDPAGDRPLEAGEVTLTTKRGSSVSGRFDGVSAGCVTLRIRELTQSISISLSEVVSIYFSGQDNPELAGVVGTLRLDDALMRGRLTNARADANATCLAWQPQSATNAQPLTSDASGSIVYRETPMEVAKPARPPAPQRNRGFIGGLAKALADATKDVTGKAAEPRPTSPKPGELMTLELRTGDSIPFRPKRIDEDGVTFTTPLSEVTFVPHANVKAISLRSKCTPAELTAIKRERLLTVPRRQKDHPPTHLLLSVDKDILRGRLVSMDEKFVTVEVRLTPRRIPRDRVAAIVWLDAAVDTATDRTSGTIEADASDEPNATGKTDTDDASDDHVAANERQENTTPPTGFHVLAMKRGGQRITILPDRCSENVLHGKNPVLEACKLDLAEVDRLAFGSDILTVVGKLSTSQIVMTSATQPRFMTEDEEEGGASGAGRESTLVGKPAPPIKLKRLAGKKYDLTQEKGKIIVLDFWATWCGPCIQWMPRADGIVAEFADHNVELVAVNLSETAEDIRPVLERLEISPTVVLDMDGVVAAAYQATAIPQTVVIDREGNVDRIFIGGGKQNEELLRDALKTLIESS